MRTLLALLSGGMIVASCAATRTDTIRRRGDPEVIVAGGSGSFPVGSAFSFVSPSGTSPVTLPGGSPCVVGGISVPDCIYQNSTDSTWSSLTFTISPGGQSGPFSCSALAYFTSCSFNSTGTQVTFFGGPGIGAGNDFLVEVLLWLPNTQFKGKAKESGQLAFRRQRTPQGGSKFKFDATPGPLTVGLLLIGLGTLLVGRGLWTLRLIRRVAT